jgi:hypothetical protein
VRPGRPPRDGTTTAPARAALRPREHTFNMLAALFNMYFMTDDGFLRAPAAGGGVGPAGWFEAHWGTAYRPRTGSGDAGQDARRLA